MLTKKGGPEALQVVEQPLMQPGPGQLRIRVQAAGMGATDLAMLNGNYPFAPKIPFVLGYEVAGVVDAIGASVVGFDVGQRVAALTVYGAFAEFLTREVERYRPQLERYAALARKLGPEPVRVGLYFPLMGEWREWAPES